MEKKKTVDDDAWADGPDGGLDGTDGVLDAKIDVRDGEDDFSSWETVDGHPMAVDSDDDLYGDGEFYAAEPEDAGLDSVEYQLRVALERSILEATAAVGGVASSSTESADADAYPKPIWSRIPDPNPNPKRREGGPPREDERESALNREEALETERRRRPVAAVDMFADTTEPIADPERSRRLPRALEELLQGLQGSEALGTMPDLWEPRFGDFFCVGGTEWNSEVRHRVLAAIGSSSCLHEVRIYGSYALTASEMAALLTPLRSNPAIQEVSLVRMREDLAGTLCACRLLGDVLRAPGNAIRKLSFTSTSVSPACVAALASGLQDNRDRNALETVAVEGWGDCDVAVQIAEIVRGAPRLSSLYLGHSQSVHPGASEALRAALLLPSTALRTLAVRSLDDGGLESLVRTLASNRSVKQLHIVLATGCKVPASALVDLLSGGGGALEEITFAQTFSPFLRREWREIGLSLLRNPAFRSLSIGICEIDTAPSIDSLVQGFGDVDGPLPKPVIELGITIHASALANLPHPSSSIDWTRFCQFVRCSSFLKDLKLSFVLESSPVPSSSLQSLLESVAHNPSLKSLAVRVPAYRKGWPWRSLFDGLRVNSTLAKLTLVGHLDEAEFDSLLDLLAVNSSLESVDLQRSPWDLDGREARVRSVLERNRELRSRRAPIELG